MEKKAINIHMGVRLYFRGSSCDFGVSYMGMSELVGATVHLLSEKLDGRDILYHALPKVQEIEAFDLRMKTVEVAQDSLVDRIDSGQIFRYIPICQDGSKEIRYTKNIEFQDEVAKDYLMNLPSSQEIHKKLKKRDVSMLLNSYMK